MVVSQPATQPMTIDEFMVWSNLPENEERRFELVDGVPEEYPLEGYLHGLTCAMMAYLLCRFAINREQGHALCNNTGLVISGRRNTLRGPDVIFFNESKPLSEMTNGPVVDVPALVVEVYSPSDRHGKLSQRVADYFTHGIPMVWVVYPEDQVVDVYRPNHSVQAHTITDTLTGYNELPDLQMKVADIFQQPGA